MEVEPLPNPPVGPPLALFAAPPPSSWPDPLGPPQDTAAKRMAPAVAVFSVFATTFMGPLRMAIGSRLQSTGHDGDDPSTRHDITAIRRNHANIMIDRVRKGSLHRAPPGHEL